MKKLYNINMKSRSEVGILGKVECVDFPHLGIQSVPARIDTGAKTSAIWASDIIEKEHTLSFRLFSPISQYYNGVEIVTTEYGRTVVASSAGQPQERYKVKLAIRLGKRRILASFTLANRSQQVYPILIGRNTIMKKFIVDIALGQPLIVEEKERTRKLQKLITREEKDY